jgi:hypothetical protein
LVVDRNERPDGIVGRMLAVSMWNRRSFAKSLGVVAAVLLFVRVAGSQEPAGKEAARPSASQADASASEQRAVIKALQAEVKALEDELTRVREQLVRVDEQLERLQAAPAADRDAPQCSPPYVVADDGIKRFRTECLARPPCDPPFFFDRDGTKRFRDECMAPEATSNDDPCNPPYYLREDGTKVFKANCL